MIKGIGTDIIETERIANKLLNESGLKESLFTEKEIKYCQSKRFPYQHFAARYAAKEAFFKALGTGWRNGMRFTEIEIENNELGKPELKITGKVNETVQKNGIKNMQLSISHIKSIAVAFVILED